MGKNKKRNLAQQEKKSKRQRFLQAQAASRTSIIEKLSLSASQIGASSSIISLLSEECPEDLKDRQIVSWHRRQKYLLKQAATNPNCLKNKELLKRLEDITAQVEYKKPVSMSDNKLFN